ncbi:hypothetical protein F511_31466 [Dorcoceras hygrometricum]|uniref:Uncharacterized protein n=1 Tax=Dorcoceras hygrometricum TaxID=472368 RepID=A0A2Z7DDM5_9LAMI|nr:hypothetical protein F511_31466 [Dorcoceras hygrometricum]
MVKWQHRGVRDPEVRSDEPHRHIEHAEPLDSLGLNGACDILLILSRPMVRTFERLLQLLPRDQSDVSIYAMEYFQIFY